MDSEGWVEWIDIGKDASIVASTIELEVVALELTNNLLEVGLDGVVAGGLVGSKPSHVRASASRVIHQRTHTRW
jgi:hypothetical protein